MSGLFGTNNPNVNLAAWATSPEARKEWGRMADKIEQDAAAARERAQALRDSLRAARLPLSPAELARLPERSQIVRAAVENGSALIPPGYIRAWRKSPRLAALSVSLLLPPRGAVPQKRDGGVFWSCECGHQPWQGLWVVVADKSITKVIRCPAVGVNEQVGDVFAFAAMSAEELNPGGLYGDWRDGAGVVVQVIASAPQIFTHIPTSGVIPT